MSINQPPSSKQAEVRYRNLLKKGKFKDQEPSGEELMKLLSERAERARKTFTKLQKEGTPFTPFLEIGAERGQRAMLLASEFDAKGFMLDLSLDSLKEAESMKTQFDVPAIPQRVCADAYHLPFPDNTFAFIFAYQTLHHFPNPKPILQEVYRVLTSGGVFFLDEEPIRQTINLRLWRRPTKLRWWEKVLKGTLILHFLSEIGKSEVDAGIIETAFDLQTWQKALSVFDKVEATLSVFPLGPSQTLSQLKQILPLNHLLLKILGGNMRAFCTKKSKGETKQPRLACPVCSDHPDLTKQRASWTCLECKETYPINNGIPILIEKKLRQKLYG